MAPSGRLRRLHVAPPTLAAAVAHGCACHGGHCWWEETYALPLILARCNPIAGIAFSHQGIAVPHPSYMSKTDVRHQGRATLLVQELKAFVCEQVTVNGEILSLK